MRKLTLVAASVALAAAPIAPIAAQAAPERVSAPVAAEREQLVGKVLTPIIIAILLGLGILLLSDGGDNPTSP